MNSNNGRPGQETAAVTTDLTSIAQNTGTSANASACLAAALRYASFGVHVFPLGVKKMPVRLCPACRPPAACPGQDGCSCGVDTCHGFYAATTDPETIRRWWETHPEWQLGIRTGQQSGLVALDVDLDKGGLDSLIALQRRGLAIQGTAVQLSGSGKSFHLIYAHPGGHVPCSAGRLGPGLDLRGDGGYVVGAPSRHASTGATYELLGDLTGLPLWSLQTASQTAADSLCGIGGRSTTPLRPATVATVLTRSRVRGLVRQVENAPVGTRRATLFWAACRLGESAGTQRGLVLAAQQLHRAALTTGLSSFEVHRTLLDGIREGRSS